MALNALITVSKRLKEALPFNQLCVFIICTVPFLLLIKLVEPACFVTLKHESSGWLCIILRFYLASAYVDGVYQESADGCGLMLYVDAGVHEAQSHPNRSHVYADDVRREYEYVYVVMLRDDAHVYDVRLNEAIHQSS